MFYAITRHIMLYNYCHEINVTMVTVPCKAVPGKAVKIYYFYLQDHSTEVLHYDQFITNGF